MAADEGLPLIEGDNFHPPANIDKMRAGVALTDADRADWLGTLGTELQRHPHGAVLTCSALKRAYRDTLRAAVPGLLFAFMEISQADAQARVEARADAHIFPGSLVASQFATLESPAGEPGVLVLPATARLDQLTALVGVWWTGLSAHQAPDA